MGKVFAILLFIHIFVIVRYCVGNIIRPASVTTREYSKWLLIVVFIPFYGYYRFMKKSVAEERALDND